MTYILTVDGEAMEEIEEDELTLRQKREIIRLFAESHNLLGVNGIEIIKRHYLTRRDKMGL